MKNILFLLLFVSSFCFGQNTYTVTEGELAFINPEEGIIVYINNVYSKLEIHGPIKDGRMTFKTSALPLSQETIDRLKENPENIYPEDLVSINITQLKKIRFTSNLEGEKSVISLLNNEFFVEEEYDFEGNLHHISQTAYLYINFDTAKIIYLENIQCLIMGVKNEFILYHPDWEKRKYKIKKTKTKLSIEAIEKLYFAFNHYYRTDTINNKIGLLNYFNEQALPTKYDSIVVTSNFLITYKNQDVELYNHALSQLKLKKLRAVKQMRHFPVVYILQKNEQKKINILGLEENIPRSTILYGSEYSPERYPTTFSKKGDEFYIDSPGIGLFTSDLIWEGEKRKLYNTRNLDSIYLWHDEIEIDFFNKISSNTICICRMDSGKYKLEYLTNFLFENFENLSQIHYEETIMNDLDFVEAHSSYLKFVKNGLIGYYPYNKTAKYKEIEEYRGFENFIRFTLPDGRKGWLDTDGKEYLDE